VNGPLRVLASDVALLAPEHYPPNPVAQRAITILSGLRIRQPWRGHVALVQYDRDEETREWLWPGDMAPAWVERVTQAVREAADA
jgi:hypothetical protein